MKTVACACSNESECVGAGPAEDEAPALPSRRNGGVRGTRVSGTEEVGAEEGVTEPTPLDAPFPP